MKQGKQTKRILVRDSAEALRRLILAAEPDTYLGSLNEVAERLGVGIVTVQQAARILEHEGLLAVKRGPGGGYYGARPDDSALERAFATYLRLHEISHRDVFELTVLLDCEIIKAAATEAGAPHQATMDELLDQLQRCSSADDVIQFELDFRNSLLQAVKRPLLELLSRIAMQLYQSDADPNQFVNQINLDTWRQGRRRILQAVIQQDTELAYFEAQRFQTLIQSWINRTP
ncbi:FadR/GntR family transcriptional regulator [Halioxenophilus sp. WMMB6]|uniref:FadR/GntR family transcriptional regulator n=1 Tax=Halioxenophilus sp. WMMB6 TaxID=3073815 RepID=UPI00295E2D8E|nr:FCD domain-containing protein [Halioxenophilus sp. WMMB6]